MVSGPWSLPRGGEPQSGLQLDEVSDGMEEPSQVCNLGKGMG